MWSPRAVYMLMKQLRVLLAKSWWSGMFAGPGHKLATGRDPLPESPRCPAVPSAPRLPPALAQAWICCHQRLQPGARNSETLSSAWGSAGLKPQINPGDLEDGVWGLQGVLEPQLPTAMFWARQERSAQVM